MVWYNRVEYCSIVQLIIAILNQIESGLYKEYIKVLLKVLFYLCQDGYTYLPPHLKGQVAQNDRQFYPEALK